MTDEEKRSLWLRDPRSGNVALVEPRHQEAAEKHNWSTVADADHWRVCSAAMYEYPKTPDDQVFCAFIDGHQRVQVIDPTEADPEPEVYEDHGNPWAGAWWTDTPPLPPAKPYDAVAVTLVSQDRIRLEAANDPDRAFSISPREAARIIGRLANCLRDVTPNPAHPERPL